MIVTEKKKPAKDEVPLTVKAMRVSLLKYIDELPESDAHYGQGQGIKKTLKNNPLMSSKDILKLQRSLVMDGASMDPFDEEIEQLKMMK